MKQKSFFFARQSAPKKGKYLALRVYGAAEATVLVQTARHQRLQPACRRKTVKHSAIIVPESGTGRERQQSMWSGE
ncbi:hypothetical protein F3I27_11685 [Pantoea sp. Bo_2]|uniref:hypothetical protein n=1 Tax=unclassified Pantoea TaxID=2630326 RepID=UPI0012328E11|nr:MULTISPECIES: hypothetical protein [unclassified Pantoea]KAA5947013.1 hypothetical protein F3I57_08855 [Pantoea sp. VH_3]KAA5951504.1 hypothetical protein F3I55_19945 [Pantoea sp. VH_24]KAA5952174.1 hypothetical protein F3I56_11435 [Pantoea sp. VH_25]KAA5961541.1 hypothetical protein F3I53_09135 [Pantoea sp. VH_16]KAA5965587.1 hypothetical protein F3I54_09185 [Pantoea sp. VH_18]